MYSVNVPVAERREIVLGGERMEVVKEFKYSRLDIQLVLGPKKLIRV